MSTNSGRPRKACGTCMSQKIRCSGERPICKRCSRLNHTCVYSSEPRLPRKSVRPGQAAHPVATETLALQTSPQSRENQSVRRGATPKDEIIQAYKAGIQVAPPTKVHYLGVPSSLVLTLVDVYFENVYNASLLLHKGYFLKSLTDGSARPHIVLSVCAWGANFYRDEHGQQTLKSHGFMMEWAQRASDLVLQEVEEFHEENIATFCNLALFWHSQGSWRKSAFHKGTACNMLSIIGIGSGAKSGENSLAAEMRRRRFWACYLMHCQNTERLTHFEPLVDTLSLPVPWPEDEFDACISTRPVATLESVPGNGGIFCELIKVITLWSSVLNMIKSSDISPSERIASIHALDEKLSLWWRKLKSEFKLSPTNISKKSSSAISKIFFLNIVYHQALCALHASIVPLFCWAPSDDTWSSARHLSAQVAFEHAGASSILIEAMLAVYPNISSMPGFVAYAAYCGCAIQIPFMWCLDTTVKARAQANVKANVRMIHNMAKYWKYSALLKIHVRALFTIHAKRPTILENEPKLAEIEKLTNFNISATNAQESILGYTGILRSKLDGLTRPGDEASLQIEENLSAAESGSRISSSTSNKDLASTQSDLQNPGQQVPLYPDPMSACGTGQGQHGLGSDTNSSQILNIPLLHNPGTLAGGPTLDLLHPFFDTEMLDLFSNGEVPDLSQFDTSPFSLDYFDVDNWNNAGGELV